MGEGESGGGNEKVGRDGADIPYRLSSIICSDAIY